MKFSTEDFFSKYDQIRTWSHLLKKSLMENFISCAVYSVIESECSYCFISEGILESFCFEKLGRLERIYDKNYIKTTSKKKKRNGWKESDF